MIKPVVIAGGTGTRLWPLSRAAHPKQFLKLYDNLTMLQATFSRLGDLNIKSSVTVCNEEHRFFVAEQLREINKLGSIILEPVGRNTAPAITLAALLSLTEEDPILLVLPADHVIQSEDVFVQTVKDAIPLAESGKLVTFGINAYEPNTEYGYIKKGSIQKPVGFQIEAFIEKPTIDLAKEYVESNDYLWNSGMFLFKASSYLNELERHCPEVYEACKLSMKDMSKDNDFIRINESVFKSCPSDSIDYAVMEKTSNAVVVPMDAGWNDLGSWSSLWDIGVKDECGNVLSGDVMPYQSHNSLIRTDGKLVAAIGVDDLVIVSTKDALIVAHKDNVKDVQVIVKELKSKSRDEWEHHREVYRPWGKYDSIDTGPKYQVKRITVNPGAKLSLQKHHHRSEHWVVVSGTARVTNGDKIFMLHENQSTFIPLGVIHALENPGDSPLEMIEVQSGSYLGEDDIVRYEDIYGRVPI
jgi:mannose-1-phosphate guanylyltransferase